MLEPGLPYPHFIIIGASKCGTSWLLLTLGQHPNIIVFPKEIEYFSSYIHRQSLDWYLGHFDQRVTELSATKTTPYVVGEKSAGYCMVPRDRIPEVHRLLPDVRLILMMRDPVAQTWARAKQYLSKPRKAEKEGGDVLSIPRERLFDLLGRWHRRGGGDFAAMVDNWTSVYPAEQLLLVSQEHTLADPRTTLDAVLEHIGVSTQYDPASIPLLSGHKNRGPAIDMPDDVREFLEPMFVSEQQYVREMFSDAGVVNAANAPAR